MRKYQTHLKVKKIDQFVPWLLTPFVHHLLNFFFFPLFFFSPFTIENFFYLSQLTSSNNTLAKITKKKIPFKLIETQKKKRANIQAKQLTWISL